MKPYNQVQKGSYSREVRSGNSITTTYFTNSNARAVTLSCGANVKGDFVRPNPQTFDRTQVSYLKGFYRRGFIGVPDYILETGFLGHSPVGVVSGNTFDSVTYNMALARLYERVRGELDLSIDMLQSRQAGSMVSSCLRGLRNLSSTVLAMRRNPGRAASNAWLQFTYGWKPLASSIYQTAQLFQKGPPEGFVSVTTTGRDTSRKAFSQNLIGDSNLLAKTIEERSYRCKFSVNYSIKPSVLNNLSALTSLNPVSIVWELVPYSFVIDWVVDIGGYLRNMESALLYAPAFLRGYVTEGYLITGTSAINGAYSGGGSNYSASLNGSYRFSGKRRAVLGTSPTPRPPRFHVDLGANRLLSAAALLQQRLR